MKFTLSPRLPIIAFLTEESKIMSAAEISLQTDQASGCEKSGCCSTSDDGSAICVVPPGGQQGSSDEPLKLSGLQVKTQLSFAEPAETRWQQVRGGLMLAVACITSPCCMPLLVPIGLALLAGTPVAVWAGQNLGLVYGGFTLLSALSLFLGWRWLNSPHPSSKPIKVSG
jgi:hypothetical protein